MAASQPNPQLADAAHVLSDQLRGHLRDLASVLLPGVDKLDQRFTGRLKKLGFDDRQRTALLAITTGSAARVLAAGRPMTDFFETIEYNGRRLAKLNVPPNQIMMAVEEYDRLLDTLLQKLTAAERQNFAWVREQLYFAVILTLNNAYYQVREAETAAFYRLSRVELESSNLDELLKGFVETLVEAFGADAGHLFFYEPEHQCWRLRAAMEKGRGSRKRSAVEEIPNRSPILKRLSEPRQFVLDGRPELALLNPHWQTRYAYCWSVPIAGQEKVAGVLQLAFRKSWEWLPRELELLRAATERCLIAAEKARLMEDLARREETIRGLAEHMIHVEEAERRRISRELHDEAGQSMLCIRLALEMIEGSLDGRMGPEQVAAVRQRVEDTRDITERTILDIRRLIAALSPAVLQQLGLGAALRQLVSRFRQVHPCTIKLQLTRLASVPKKTEIIVYRIVQECFNNIGKHSQATHVNISLASVDKRLRLRVEDNGIGFDLDTASSKPGSFGLDGMRERVTLLGGQFSIDSWTKLKPRLKLKSGSLKPGLKSGRAATGTLVQIEIPLGAESPVEEAVAG